MSLGMLAVRRRALACALAIGALVVAVVLAGCASGTASGAQRLSVDLSSGHYVPSEITATAGTPISITFGKGQGCVKKLVSTSLKISADMTKGAQTFDVGVLAPGDYTWSCGMNMQHGVLHVK